MVNWGDVATWFSALAAVVAAFYAYRFSEKAQLQNEKTQALLDQQTELSKMAWVDQHFSGVRSWASDVCHTISEAIHLVDESLLSDFNERKHSILHRLSGHLDTGRWYFPNQWADSYGPNKPPAYRGIRKEVLDCIFDAYELVQQVGSEDAILLKDKLVLAQRNFVSHVQLVIDPVRREEEIAHVISQFKSASKLRADSDTLGSSE